MRTTADVDLPWFFGTGPQTAQGDAGLRSPLGPQLDALRSGVQREHTAADASRSEDEAIGRLGVAERYATIEARLRMVPTSDAEVLRVHYSERPLPYAISAAATIVEGSTRDSLSALLRADDGRLRRSVELRANTRLAVAKSAYDAAVPPSRGRRRR